MRQIQLTNLRLFLQIILFLICINFNGYGQDTADISTPSLQLIGDKVSIRYDINSHSNNNQYNIWIKVYDSNGNSLNARSLTGDIGHKVDGGKGKEIIWDPKADNIALDEGISVEVFAELEESIPVTKTDKSTSNHAQVKTASIMVQSLLFPGIGLSRVTGKPHWIKGVVGYGCIGGSIVLNRMAHSTYTNEYLSASDITDRELRYEKSISQDNLSKTLAYSAIGVWIIDIAWNVLGVAKLNNKSSSAQNSITVEPYYEFELKAPMVALRYTF
ncbi:MAG: hypothetical protein GY790_06130 [Bacteroidetes bacterium]|nr:hypothetical protein [Bacteroidota bacterium]